eukprot:2428696-Pleurochrysis_carterae.AAC.1
MSLAYSSSGSSLSGAGGLGVSLLIALFLRKHVWYARLHITAKSGKLRARSLLLTRCSQRI